MKDTMHAHRIGNLSLKPFSSIIFPLAPLPMAAASQNNPMEPDPLVLTRIVSTAMLKRSSASLNEMFEPILFLQKWQQAPIGHIMVDWHDMIKEMLEVSHTYNLKRPTSAIALT